MKIGISAGLALVGMLLMFFSAPYSSFFLIILGAILAGIGLFGLSIVTIKYNELDWRE